MTKTFYIVFIAFSLLSVLLPIRRPLLTDTTVLGPGIDYLFKIVPYIPVLAMIAIYYQMKFPKLFVGFDKLIQVKYLNKAAILLMPLALALFVLRVPGPWWTWTTLTFHIVVAVIIANLLAHRLKPTSALLVGGAVVSLGAGLWEMLYQASLYFTYYLPQGASIEGLVFSLTFISPMVIGGTAVALQISGRPFRISPSANRPALLMLLLSTIAILVWWSTGFWQDVLYDLAAKVVYHTTDFNYLGMVAYKISKVALGLGLALLYIGGSRGKASSI